MTDWLILIPEGEDMVLQQTFRGTRAEAETEARRVSECFEGRMVGLIEGTIEWV